MIMNFPTYIQVPLLAIIGAVTASAQDAPIVVTCEQDVYALCAYAKCTINDDMKTAKCPCYSLSGPSLARIDLIPDADVKQATLDKCTDATSCAERVTLPSVRLLLAEHCGQELMQSALSPESWRLKME